MEQESLLRIERSEASARRVVLRLLGRVGAAELETLRESVGACLDSDREIELELSGLRFVSGCGAQLLDELRRKGARLCRPTGYVGELLRALERER